MARPGITQEDVNAAADALLRAGERPTIERVRAQLGTGSPNTLTRLLEVWWQDLGQRLHAVEAKLALPAAPASVVQAASTLWTEALHCAETIVGEQTAAIHVALAEERAGLAEAQRALAEKEANRVAELQDLRHRLSLAETQREDAHVRLGEQAEQLADLQRQRDQLQHQMNQLTETIAVEQQRRETLESSHRAERDRNAALLQSVEDRALRETDRAREEIKKQAAQLQQAQRDRDQALRQLTQAQDDLVGTRRSLAASDARVSALQAEIDRLHASLRAPPQRKDASASQPRTVSRQKTKKTAAIST